MKRRKLLQALSDLLDQKKSRKLKQLDELKLLLAKLEVKRIELKQEIPLEKNKRKRKRLGKELEVIAAQYEKGLKNLKKLEDL